MKVKYVVEEINRIEKLQEKLYLHAEELKDGVPTIELIKNKLDSSDLHLIEILCQERIDTLKNLEIKKDEGD